MKQSYILLTLLFSIVLFSFDYPDYANESTPDFISPDYYNATKDDSIREAINEILYRSRRDGLHHPLQGKTLPNYTIFRDFCDVVGRNPNYQYHPARDFYVENKATEVGIYASHDGIVDTCTSIARYRHNISITKTIFNDKGIELAKLTTVYAHVDLDLNTIKLTAGDSVKRGDIICSHLYSGTMGGPHLHFEIRFYDKTAKGLEDFYAWNFNTPSAGPWQYGKWDTSIGIAYGNPSNYITNSTTVLSDIKLLHISVSPNPNQGLVSLNSNIPLAQSTLILRNCKGSIVRTFHLQSDNENIDISQLCDGLYFGQILFDSGHSRPFKVLKKSS